ncbi:hypothetical protein Tco_0555285, partial [Tanacetum coccineum]
MVSYNHIIRKNLRLQRAANSQGLQDIHGRLLSIHSLPQPLPNPPPLAPLPVA